MPLSYNVQVQLRNNNIASNASAAEKFPTMLPLLLCTHTNAECVLYATAFHYFLALRIIVSCVKQVYIFWIVDVNHRAIQQWKLSAV